MVTFKFNVLFKALIICFKLQLINVIDNIIFNIILMEKADLNDKVLV